MYTKCDIFTLIVRYTAICLTKLDILDTLPEIKVCVGYRLNGEEIDYVPSITSELAKVETIYEQLEGWLSNTEGTRALEKLPPNAQKYVRKIEDYLGIPGKWWNLTFVHFSIFQFSNFPIFENESHSTKYKF